MVKTEYKDRQERRNSERTATGSPQFSTLRRKAGEDGWNTVNGGPEPCFVCVVVFCHVQGGPSPPEEAAPA